MSWIDALCVFFATISVMASLIGFICLVAALAARASRRQSVQVESYRDTIGAVAALSPEPEPQRPLVGGFEDQETCRALVEVPGASVAWQVWKTVELPSGAVVTQEEVKAIAAKPQPLRLPRESHSEEQLSSTIVDWTGVLEDIERKGQEFHRLAIYEPGVPVVNLGPLSPQQLSWLTPPPKPESHEDGPPHLQREFKAECECPWGHFGIHNFELGEAYGILNRVCSYEPCGREWTESSE